jgi:hypothetical protein
MSISGHHRLSLAEAKSVAKRGRRLLRAGRITAKTYVVLDCLLWSCRNPVTGVISVSYTGLQRLCHCARETVASALRALGSLGVLTKVKRRVRVRWGGSVASRQATNAYVLHPCTESSAATVIQKPIVIQEAAKGRQMALPVPDLLALRRLAMASGLIVRPTTLAR